MPNSHDQRAPARGPTPYADLNAVLAHLLAGAQAALGDNFVGAYLQGSFAVGDFTEYSDCDFIIVTTDDLTPDQLAALQGPARLDPHTALRLLADRPRGLLRAGRDPAALERRPARSAGRAARRRLGRSRHVRRECAGLSLLVPRPWGQDPGALGARQLPGRALVPAREGGGARRPRSARADRSRAARCAPERGARDHGPGDAAQSGADGAGRLAGVLGRVVLPDAAHARDRGGLVEEGQHGLGAGRARSRMARLDRARRRRPQGRRGPVRPTRRSGRRRPDPRLRPLCPGVRRQGAAGAGHS